MSHRDSSSSDAPTAHPPLPERWFAALAALLLRTHGATLRWREDGLERIQALRATGRPLLLVTWHGRLLLLIYHMRRCVSLIMISRSRDGDRIAAVCERFGWSTVRGSSSRAGVRALLELVRLLTPGRVAGHLVDGPRGPAGEIKPGLILAAQRSGAAIVPVYATAAHRWEARSWDRMQIAWPFSRVLLRYGTPVDVPPDLDASAAEQLRLELERDMRNEFAQLEAELWPHKGARGSG